MEIDRVSFGKRLNKVRKEKHLTSEGLSEKCGVNAVHIRKIENASKMPSVKTLVNICNALHVSVDYLLADSLEASEHEQFDNLWKKMRSLTPNQLDLVMAMLDTMLEKLEK